jgi:FKBP-type peptidyl-prolyl cis-trans isomerase FkpA
MACYSEGMRILALFMATAVVSAQVPAAKPAVAKAKAAVAGAKAVGAAKKTAAGKKAAAAPSAAMTDEEKTIYALGLSIYQSLKPFALTAGELEVLKRSLTDALNKQPAVELQEWGPKIDPMARGRMAKAMEVEKAASTGFLAKLAAEPGATKTESGLVYREMSAGTGASPKATDMVKVHYRGTFTNGEEFDSSYKRNEPAQFPLNGVIKCWTEGVQKMKVGGKAKLACPSDIAYGDGGRGPIPGGATLLFDVELIEIMAPPPAPPAPPAPAAVPAPAPATPPPAR